MDFQLAETLRMLIGASGAVGVVIAILKYRLRRAEIEKGGDRALEPLIDALRHEIQDMRAEQAELLADMQDRLEFAERLLTKARQEVGD